MNDTPTIIEPIYEPCNPETGEELLTGDGASTDFYVPPRHMLRLGSLVFSTIAEQEAAMVDLANRVGKLIKERKLSMPFGRGPKKKDYVFVDGWEALCLLIGVTAREVRVEEVALPNDGGNVFKATVELIRNSDGAVIGRGSSECGCVDEVDKDGNPIWADRPRYARKSMAITRATGKAIRICFSPIIKMAGYATTPAEEMQGIDDGPRVESTQAPVSKRPETPTDSDWDL